VLAVGAIATCSTNDQVEACPTPVPGSAEARTLESTRLRADFTLLFPCYLPNTERLMQGSVVGEQGEQRTEITFEGAFDMALRQSQVPPPIEAEQTGASRITLQLFPGTEALLIEKNDGSSRALYHLLWERGGTHYELQAFGPPLQRATVLKIARSLQ
jgi:hypothetical protein